MNSFLKFFALVKNNKRLKAPRARTIENLAKMLKADWFKNDIHIQPYPTRNYCITSIYFSFKDIINSQDS